MQKAFSNSSNGKCIIGVDAGGTKVAYGLFNSDGKLIGRTQHATDPYSDGPAFADKIIETINNILKNNGLTYAELKGVGICMPSYILFDTGHIYLTSAIPAIKDFAMLAYLRERLPVKIALDNDSNAAALAEHRFGAGKGSRHMVYVAAGTGIGSGIIIDGNLFRGSYGWAGECGHMLATPGVGVDCGCENKGCFMSYASGKFIPTHIKNRIASGENSMLENYSNADCADLISAYNQDDKLAIEIIEEVAHWLAVCVYNIYQMLNINLFVFGGGLVNFGDALFSRVKARFDSYNHIPQPVYFRFAELEEDFGIIGAAEFIKE